MAVDIQYLQAAVDAVYAGEPMADDTYQGLVAALAELEAFSATAANEGNKGFVRGACWAMALTRREDGMTAELLMYESGFTQAQAVEAGVADYDMEALAPLWPPGFGAEAGDVEGDTAGGEGAG